jgi:hypothetical protein
MLSFKERRKKQLVYVRQRKKNGISTFSLATVGPSSSAHSYAFACHTYAHTGTRNARTTISSM